MLSLSAASQTAAWPMLNVHSCACQGCLTSRCLSDSHSLAICCIVSNRVYEAMSYFSAHKHSAMSDLCACLQTENQQLIWFGGARASFSLYRWGCQICCLWKNPAQTVLLLTVSYPLRAVFLLFLKERSGRQYVSSVREICSWQPPQFIITQQQGMCPMQLRPPNLSVSGPYTRPVLAEMPRPIMAKAHSPLPDHHTNRGQSSSPVSSLMVNQTSLSHRLLHWWPSVPVCLWCWDFHTITYSC